MKTDTLRAPLAYFPDFVDSQEASVMLRQLLHGKTWVGSADSNYRYSWQWDGVSRPGDEPVITLRRMILEGTGHLLNWCRLIHLRSGADTLDFGPSLYGDVIPNPEKPILLVTLGASRDLTVRRAGSALQERMTLDHGAILVKQAGTALDHEYAMAAMTEPSETVILLFGTVKS